MSRYLLVRLYERLESGEFKELPLVFNNEVIDLYWGQSVLLSGYSKFLEDNEYIKRKGIDEVWNEEDEFPITYYPYSDFIEAALRMKHCAIASSVYEKVIECGEFVWGINEDMIKSIPEFVSNPDHVYEEADECKQSKYLYAYIPENFEMHKVAMICNLLKVDLYCNNKSLYIGFRKEY